MRSYLLGSTCPWGESEHAEIPDCPLQVVAWGDRTVVVTSLFESAASAQWSRGPELTCAELVNLTAVCESASSAAVGKQPACSGVECMLEPYRSHALARRDGTQQVLPALPGLSHHDLHLIQNHEYHLPRLAACSFAESKRVAWECWRQFCAKRGHYCILFQCTFRTAQLAPRPSVASRNRHPSSPLQQACARSARLRARLFANLFAPCSWAGTIYSHVLIWRFDASVIAAESATHPGMKLTAPVTERLSGHIGVVWCLAWYGQLPLTVPLRLG